MRLRCSECVGCEVDWADVGEPGWQCPNCGFEARWKGPVLDLVDRSTRETYQTFKREYSAIRMAEGRGSEDPEYYRALPEYHGEGELAWQWAIRAKTYRCFERRVLAPLEREAGRPLAVLDLGAGAGWLANRLAERGHRPAAVDLLDDPLDGLGAVAHYEPRFPALLAGFDRLPVADDQFDLVIYNASFHYSVDYRRTLQEARRVLGWGGRVVILDTPLYREAAHGERMREERHRQFEERYGFRSDSIASMEYLDEDMLTRLSRDLNIRWTRYQPWYGIAWALRPYRAALTGKRPPSRFWVLAGHWPGA